MTNPIGYLDTRNGKQERIARPSWWQEDGETPVTDELLVSEGIYPLYGAQPEGTRTHRYEPAGYTLFEDRAEAQFDEVEKTVFECGAWIVNTARTLFQTKISAGYPYNGLHVEINDGSRANLGGLALTAALVSLGVPGAAWPEDYGRGWVSIEGERIPLTPQTAIPFASAAGAYYSALVQAEQDIEDAVLAAEDHDALAAIDITSGWPE